MCACALAEIKGTNGTARNDDNTGDNGNGSEARSNKTENLRRLEAKIRSEKKKKM